MSLSDVSASAVPFYESLEPGSLERLGLQELEPLRAARRLVHFDTEGDFQVDGRHAEIARDLLGAAGVEAEVRDRWIPGRGRALVVEAGERTWRWLAEPDALWNEPDRPGEYAHLDLLRHVVAEVADGVRAVVLDLGGQDVIVACVPSAVAADLRQRFDTLRPEGAPIRPLSAEELAALEDAIPAPSPVYDGSYGQLLREGGAEAGFDLLQAGHDPEEPDRNGWTLLRAAIRVARSPALVRALLDAGVDPNAWPDFYSPLGHAAQEGLDEAVEALLEAGADPNVSPSPLYGASTGGHLHLVQRLLEAGARPDAPGGPLETAASQGEQEELELYLAIDLPQEALDSAFVESRTRPVMERLLAAGADLHGRTRGLGWLHAHGDAEPELVRYLLEQGYDPDHRDRSEKTPLFRASVEVTRLLLEAGADPDARDKYGVNALFESLEDPEKTRLLLEAGAEPDPVSRHGWTPLLRARDPEVAVALLAAGARPVEAPGEGDALRMLPDEAAEAVRAWCAEHGVPLPASDPEPGSSQEDEASSWMVTLAVAAGSAVVAGRAIRDRVGRILGSD